MNQLSVIRKIGKSLIIPFFLLIVTLSASIYGFTRLLSKADWVEHTNLVLLKLQNIISVLKDAETGQRGYLLTEDPEFLEPFIGSYYKVIQDYNEVRQLVADNRNQLKRLDTLLALINDRYNLLNKTIALEKEQNRDAALEIVLQKEGKRTMDKMRGLIARMENEEILLKEERFSDVKASTVITSALLVVSSFLTLLTVLRAFALLKKKIKTERDLNEELTEKNEEYLRTQECLKVLNTTLEEKVEERTYRLSNAKDELENLSVELKHQNEKLKRINNDLDNFIYIASHDLKAPITNIEGLITLLKKKECYQHEEWGKLIDMMSVSGLKLKSVIKDLALIVEVQNEIDYNVEEINIKQAIDEIGTSIKDILDSASAKIIVNSEECKSITFSKNNFRSILYNLVTNAIKYKSPDRAPVIRIKTNREEPYSVMTVTDNGMGIEASKADKIFSIFKRLHSHVEGSGIGLFIVKRIIDNAGGKIEVFSEEGKGTTFKISFLLHLKDR